MARAVLATGMLAVHADPGRTERGLAAMAGAANPHTDGTVNTLDGVSGGRLPLVGFKGETIFGEQSTGPVLLDGAPVGDHGWNARSSSSRSRLGFLDGGRRGRRAIHRLEMWKKRRKEK